MFKEGGDAVEGIVLLGDEARVLDELADLFDDGGGSAEVGDEFGDDFTAGDEVGEGEVWADDEPFAGEVP